ncbi:MAG: NAD(P)H-dependent oxidoreductase subunit E [Mariprofundaceae bacterium]
MSKPTLMPYKWHAIMCAGKACGENMPLLNYLKERVIEAGLIADDSDAVRVNRAGCLGVCEQGPIMVVYPGGVWYCRLTEEKIDRIIEEHFKQGKAVKEFTFHISDR